MINIRLLNISDKENVSKLLQSFISESVNEYGFIFSPKQFELLFEQYKNTSFVLEQDGKVVGALCGGVYSSLIDGELTYTETMWYVDKANRKYGIKLLRYVENWCRENGIKKMIMVHMGNRKVEMFSNLYKRLDYKLLEIQYIKEL